MVKSIKNYSHSDSEGISLDANERSSEVQNASILVLLGGVLHILFGYQSYLLSIDLPNPLFIVVSSVMIVLGILSVGVSLGLWQMRSWAANTITGIGLAICVANFLFGYYTIAAMAVIIYWVAINQLKTSRAKSRRLKGESNG